MKKNLIVNIFGWYGTIAIVLAYALLSFQFISANNLIYQILNGTGALGIVYISFKDPKILSLEENNTLIIKIIRERIKNVNIEYKKENEPSGWYVDKIYYIALIPAVLVFIYLLIK